MQPPAVHSSGLLPGKRCCPFGVAARCPSETRSSGCQLAPLAKGAGTSNALSALESSGPVGARALRSSGPELSTAGPSYCPRGRTCT
eukprot:11038439-Heterocapsa_arctica.AAC.1